MKSITVHNIIKTFPGKPPVQALQGVNLDIEKGELFGLIGPDGAGKSTLFRLIASLQLPDSGSITMEGLDVLKDYMKVRKLIGYMPGKFSLYQDLSVEENIRFFATLFNTTLEENYHLVKDIYIQLEPFKKRRAGKLSGGMKQKLALCCALIHKPEVLLLDEPTTGVDPVSRKEFWEMLHRLKALGITVLVSTPYMDEAMQCDRVALMQHGTLLQVDTPDNIIASYDKPIYAVTGNNSPEVLHALREWEGSYSCFAFGEALHLTLQSEQYSVESVRKFLDEKNINGVEMEAITPGIEDCFMAYL
ncbi:MAG TPA: ABC transporter ATP-binding protein [Chitinophagales bacterium]|nr:ABC transporter ATP-binding protein [Chitinophagales bacterium]